MSPGPLKIVMTKRNEKTYVFCIASIKITAIKL